MTLARRAPTRWRALPTKTLHALHEENTARLDATRYFEERRTWRHERAAYDLHEIETELDRRGTPPERRWYHQEGPPS